MQIELRFNTGERDLVVVPGPAVKAVIARQLADDPDFRAKNGGLQIVEKVIPQQVNAKDAGTGVTITGLNSGESAPVCYWVGGTLFCW